MPSVHDSTEEARTRVAVVGLGVMGGSLVRSLRSAPGWTVSGWSPDPEERGAAASVLDHAPDELGDSWSDADLVLLATPLLSVLELLPMASEAAPSAVLTDVASLKQPVEEAVRDLGLGDRWVGSHPMAGSEGSGYRSSRADLYRGVPIWVVEDAALPSARQRVRDLWTAVGGRPRRIGAAAHDALMARVSHLPQLAATALAATLEKLDTPAEALGPGGRDMTRLAASSPTMWEDLLRFAPAELPELLRRYAGGLEELATRLEEGSVEDIRRTMEATRRWRTASAEPPPTEDAV